MAHTNHDDMSVDGFGTGGVPGAAGGPLAIEGPAADAPPPQGGGGGLAPVDPGAVGGAQAPHIPPAGAAPGGDNMGGDAPRGPHFAHIRVMNQTNVTNFTAQAGQQGGENDMNVDITSLAALADATVQTANSVNELGKILHDSARDTGSKMEATLEQMRNQQELLFATLQANSRAAAETVERTGQVLEAVQPQAGPLPRPHLHDRDARDDMMFRGFNMMAQSLDQLTRITRVQNADKGLTCAVNGSRISELLDMLEEMRPPMTSPLFGTFNMLRMDIISIFANWEYDERMKTVQLPRDMLDFERQWQYPQFIHLQHKMKAIGELLWIQDDMARTQAQLAFRPFFKSEKSVQEFFKPRKPKNDPATPAAAGGGQGLTAKQRRAIKRQEFLAQRKAGAAAMANHQYGQPYDPHYQQQQPGAPGRGAGAGGGRGGRGGRGNPPPPPNQQDGGGG